MIPRILAAICCAAALGLSLCLYCATGARLFTQLPSESLARMQQAKQADDAFAGLGVNDLSGEPARIDNSFHFGLLPAGPGHNLADSASVLTIGGPALLLFLFSCRRRPRRV
jgi:hypothetical protein